MKKNCCFVLSLALVGLALCPAGAAIFTVDRTDEATVGTCAKAAPNDCSLRGAIAAANSNNEADTINLAEGATYTLSTVDNNANGPNGLPVIANDVAGHDLAINGNGATIQRNSASGTPSFRIVQIGSGATATLNGVIIENASTGNHGGGGILNDHGTLTVQNCTFNLNYGLIAGGGILNDGATSGSATLTVQDSTFNSNDANSGGGIANNGLFGGNATATVSNCAFNSNTSDSRTGGGVYNDGFQGNATIAVSDSTFTSNRAAQGGGLYNVSGTMIVRNSTLSLNRTSSGDGAGIYNSGTQGGDASLTVSNCTLSSNISNQDAGGIYNEGNAGNATVTLVNSTLAFNDADIGDGRGGGIFNSGAGASLTLGNTILRSGQFGDNFFNEGGTITSLGYNLSSDAAGANGSPGFLNQPGDQITTDPKLSFALADNGGPTETHALLTGSPAIDKGKRFGSPLPTTDQRGQNRPFDDPAIANAAGGDGSDIGAFEAPGGVQSGPAFVVTTLDDRSDGGAGACTIGDCTLREAINAANTQADANTITFDAAVFAVPGPHIIDLSSALPNLSTDLTIQGPGANLATVRRSAEAGTPNFRIFTITNGTTSGPTIILSGLTMANGNSATEAGGGVLNDHGALTVSNCTLSGNSSFFGGGICNEGSGGGGASLTVQNSTLNGNSAENGGGISNVGRSNGSASLLVTNSTLSGNSATATSGGFGGGIYNDGLNGGNATLTIRNTTLSGNTASSGGGVYNDGTSGSANLTLGNTILKTGATGVNLLNQNGTITSQGNNLSSDAAGGDATTAPGGFLNVAGDHRNTDPKLGPLQNNGGPTDTAALLSGSPAIDVGNDSLAPSTDQRGFPRIGVSDIGAFEFGGVLPTPATLANISTRLRVETGDNVLIGGFIITGTQPKKVIVRGIGTSLPFADKLANPTLELRDSSGALIESNDNWIDSPNKQAIIDSTIPPSNDLESAIVAMLPANNAGYTAIVRGVGGGTGIGVVEAYDLDSSVDSKLANIATRGLVQTGDNVLIAGTIVVGQSSQKVIVRAIGPSLPVPGKMDNPTLELRDSNGGLIRSNDDWRTGGQEAEIIATTIPPANDLESAIVATLPGSGASYTAIVRGVNGTTGIAVVEVYALN